MLSPRRTTTSTRSIISGRCPRTLVLPQMDASSYAAHSERPAGLFHDWLPARNDSARPGIEYRVGI